MDTKPPIGTDPSAPQSLQSLQQTPSQSAPQGMQSLEQTPAQAVANPQAAAALPKRPSRWHSKQLMLVAIVLLLVAGLTGGAFFLNGRNKKAESDAIALGTYSVVEEPAGLSQTNFSTDGTDRNVTINGDLLLNGKLKLSSDATSDLSQILAQKVTLTPALNGVQQAGNISIAGGVVANTFQGNGSGLANLNATSISTGTIANERLDPSVTKLGQTIPLSALQSTVLSTINGIGGDTNRNLDIVGDASITVTTDSLTNRITVSNSALSAGDITSVTAGSGLTGGGSSGDVTLALDTGVVTLQGNTFNGAGQLVQLDGGGALPVLNAANLTGLNASNIASGTVADARLSANVTLQGNTFNGASQLVQLNGSGNLPALNGSALTNLNGSNIASGTVADARLTSNVTLQGNTFNISNTLVKLDGSGNLPALNGSALTSLNATNIASGTVADARLSANVTLQGNTFNGISQLIKSNGSGELPVISGVNLTNLNATNLASGTVADARLSANVTVQGNTFNGVGQLVQLDGSGILPALNGSALTNLNATNISSGTIADARLSANATLQGNTFNGINQLLKLNGSGELPVISGINLTNLNANNIAAGTVADARLTSNVTLLGNTFNLPNKLVQLDGSGNLPALNGSALTNLNASNLSSGTVADARLSANVGLLNGNQTYSGNVVFSQPLTVNVIQPSSTMTIGATNQTLTLQGDLSTKLTGTSGGNTVSLGFTGTPTGTVAYQLDAATTPGTYTICSSVGNCASAGGGVTTLGGTTNKLAKYTGSQSIGDSSISDTGTLVTIAASGLYKAGSDSTTAFRVQNAAGSTNVFTVDTTNTRVAIGQASASYPLDVSGDINSSTALRIGGNLICDTNGCATNGTSGFYIQNGSTTQTAANFNIESNSTSTPTAVLKLKTSQTADLLQAKDSSNAVIAKIDASGNISTTGQFQVSGTQISSANLSNDANLAKLNGAQTFTAANLFQNSSNSTTAFRIQNASAGNVFVADTSNTRIAIGQASAGYTLDVNGDVNIATGSSYRINGVAICGPALTCAPSSGSTSYVQNGLLTQTANMNIQSSSNVAVVAILQGAVGQSVDLLQARDSSNNVVAKITSSGAIYQGANQVCDTSNNCNYAVGSGSTNYIQNGSTTQTSANFNIESVGTSTPTAVFKAKTSQTADLIQARNSSNSVIANIDSSGNINTTGQFQVGGSQISSANLSNNANLAKLNGAQTFTDANTFQKASNSTNAFRIQNSSASNLFVADTTNQRIAINQNSANYALDVNGDISSSNSIIVGGNTVCTSSGCVSSGGINNDIVVQTANMNIQSVDPDEITAVIQGADSQTNDIFQVKDGNIGEQIMLSVTSIGQLLLHNATDSDTAFIVQQASGTGVFQVDTENGRVGVGGSLPGNLLSVGALDTVDGDAQLAVGTEGASNKGIIIQAVSGQTADLLQAQDSTGAVLASIDYEGSITVKNVILAGHIESTGPIPSIASTDTGAVGVDPVHYLYGTDVAGVIGVSCKASCITSGELLNVTFDSPYTLVTSVQLTPRNSQAAELMSDYGVFVESDENGFQVRLASGNLAANDPYEWSYTVVGMGVPNAVIYNYP